MVLFKDNDGKSNILDGRKRKCTRRQSVGRAVKRPYWKSSNGDVVDQTEEQKVKSPSSFREKARAARRLSAEDFDRSELTGKEKTNVAIQDFVEQDCKNKAASPTLSRKHATAAAPRTRTARQSHEREMDVHANEEKCPAILTPRKRKSPRRHQPEGDPSANKTKTTLMLERQESEQERLSSSKRNLEIRDLKAQIVEKETKILETERDDGKVLQVLSALRMMLGKQLDIPARDDNRSNREILQEELIKLQAELSTAKEEVLEHRLQATEKIAAAEAMIDSLKDDNASLSSELLTLNWHLEHQNKDVESLAASLATTRKEFAEAMATIGSHSRQLATQQSDLAENLRTIINLVKLSDLKHSEDDFAREMNQHLDKSLNKTNEEQTSKVSQEKTELEDLIFGLKESISQNTGIIAQQNGIIDLLNEQTSLREIEKASREKILQDKSEELEQIISELAYVRAELTETREMAAKEIQSMNADVSFWKGKCDQEGKIAEERIGRLMSTVSDMTKEKNHLADKVKQLDLDKTQLARHREVEIAAMNSAISDSKEETKRQQEQVVRLQAVLDAERTVLESRRKTCQSLEAEVSRLKDLVKKTISDFSVELEKERDSVIRIQHVLDAERLVHNTERTKATHELECQRKVCRSLEAEVTRLQDVEKRADVESKICRDFEAEALRLKDVVKQAHSELEFWKEKGESSISEIHQLESKLLHQIAQHQVEADGLNRKLAELNKKFLACERAQHENKETLEVERNANKELFVKLQETERLVEQLQNVAKQKDSELLRAKKEHEKELEAHSSSQAIAMDHLMGMLRHAKAEKMELENRFNGLLSPQVRLEPIHQKQLLAIEQKQVDMEQNLKKAVDKAALIVRMGKADLDDTKASDRVNSLKSPTRRHRTKSSKSKPSMYGHLSEDGYQKRRDENDGTSSPRITYDGRKLQFRQKGKEVITIHTDSETESF